MCDALEDLYSCVVTEKGCKFKCKLCNILLSSGHLRRRIYHFLPDKTDGSTKVCPNVKDVSNVNTKQLELHLDELDATKARRGSKRKRMNEGIASVVGDFKFQSKLKLKRKGEFSRKETDLAFARMVIIWQFADQVS